MAGLREQQKADRHRRILDAASALFRNLGYEAARMEDIAELARVSPGTVYNYFGYKGDVLVAIVAMEVEEILADGALMIDRPHLSVEDAVGALVTHYYDHSLVYLNKEMWRMAMALSIRDPNGAVSRRYTALDQQLADQICQLLKRLQIAGLVTAGLDTSAIGQMIFNNLNMMFMEFVKEERMPLSLLKDRVTQQNAPLLRLIRSSAAS
ncbi:TetR/AcrR family transcriptional regulator [Rhizobium sp. EC-SD404]|uniref:TetR/AcrR family transcriptional regulator n=1 Tax=Rhizobium sp. EC-SD404 TaxID=2038389 RepID=UPI00125BB8D1|nr:TetR/AcrR family transcriptional regulator [Rhizobium sp. EC-SD404]VVT08980.1 TetR family transcriptional regulator [Rhizobium sp. EC-SD404]